MRSIRKSLLQFIFSGADMRRWNDKLRHTELFELDKQAHKMIVAFLLWQQNTKSLSSEEQRRIGLDAVEDGRLDIGYDKSVEIIKNSAFNNLTVFGIYPSEISLRN